MRRDHVINAVKEGIPFKINMEDGKSYPVTEPFQISIGKTTVVVIDERDLPHVLPMLTMTGINYLPASK